LSPSDIVGGGKEFAASALKATGLGGSGSTGDISTNYFNKDKPKPSTTKKKGKVLDWLENSQKNKDEEVRQNQYL
jgi:hypothetical protein